MVLGEVALMKIAHEISEHEQDIDAATQTMVRRVKAARNSAFLMEQLVTQACREYIHWARHSKNVAGKVPVPYTGPSKVPVGGAAISRVIGDCFGHYVAGKTIGELTGIELDAVIAYEMKRANGSLQNAELCRRLRPLVGDKEKVKNAVPKKKAQEIFDTVMAAIFC